MTTELFGASETESLSPREEWLRRHGITAAENKDGWTASDGGTHATRPTRDEAISALALALWQAYKIPTWEMER